MATCYLHIGAPKCASTSIQRSFQSSRAWLAEEGLLYSRSDNARHDFLVSVHHENPVELKVHSRFGLDRDAVRDLARQQQDAFEALVASHPGADAFLSTELLFEQAPKMDLGGMKQYLHQHFDKVVVVALIRDPLAWVNSSAQETVKSGSSTLEAVVDDPVLPRFETIERYRDTFGTEALRVHPLETLSDGAPSLVSGFANWLFGENRFAGRLPDLSINESVPLEGLMIASEVNKFAGIALGQTRMASGDEGEVRGLSAQDFRKIGRTRFRLPAARVAQLLPRLQAQYDYLNATWATSYAPPDLSTWEDPVAIWDQETFASIGRAMNDLGQSVLHLRAELRKSRSKA